MSVAQLAGASGKNLFQNNISLNEEPERTGAFGIRGFKEINVSIN